MQITDKDAEVLEYLTELHYDLSREEELVRPGGCNQPSLVMSVPIDLQ